MPSECIEKYLRNINLLKDPVYLATCNQVVIDVIYKTWERFNIPLKFNLDYHEVPLVKIGINLYINWTEVGLKSTSVEYEDFLSDKFDTVDISFGNEFRGCVESKRIYKDVNIRAGWYTFTKIKDEDIELLEAIGNVERKFVEEVNLICKAPK